MNVAMVTTTAIEPGIAPARPPGVSVRRDRRSLRASLAHRSSVGYRSPAMVLGANTDSSSFRTDSASRCGPPRSSRSGAKPTSSPE